MDGEGGTDWEEKWIVNFEPEKNQKNLGFFCVTRIRQHLPTINGLLHSLVDEDGKEEDGEADGEEGGR